MSPSVSCQFQTLNSGVGRRGPDQLARGQADQRGGAPLGEAARQTLQGLMAEGLGDHVLLLRLYQVSILF